jgi:hypothetical protein
MTPFINERAGDLPGHEYDYGQCLAYQLVLSMIVGRYLEDLKEDFVEKEDINEEEYDDLWCEARDDISSAGQAEAVLEILASMVSELLAEKMGPDAAVLHVKKLITFAALR